MEFNKHNIRYRMDAEFRERVVRQAILLGFSARENEASGRWYFEFGDRIYSGYLTAYPAAVEYLRLIKFPMNKIGVVNHGGETSNDT